MAVTISLYNQTVKRLLNKEVDLDNIRLMLLNNTATFDATDTDLEDVANVGYTYEVFGNGWTEGGELLENVVVTLVTTNDGKIDADDITVTATGGSIGPTYKAVGYDIVASPETFVPLFFIDFDGMREAGETTDFVIRWHANGIISGQYTLPA